MRKILSLFLCWCFLLSSVEGHAVASVLAAANDSRCLPDFAYAGIPLQYGRVTDLQDFGSNQLVIMIQDLHCHPEAQRNIAHILDNLDANYGLRQVYVEGGYGDVDTSFFCGMQNQAVKKKLIENLVNRGVLTGGEYYSIQANRPTVLKGLEDEALHKKTLQQLGALLARRPYFEKQLATMDREIARLQAQYFSRRNRGFAALVERYQRGKIDSGTFYRRLLRAADALNRHPERFNARSAILAEEYPSLHHFLEVHRLSGSINYGRASRQLQAFLRHLKSTLPYKDYVTLSETTEQFSRMDAVALHLGGLAKRQSINLSAFPDLQNYLAYTEKSRAINPQRLLQEEKQLLTEFRLAYAETLPELEISFLTDFCARFRDYLLNRASPDDYAYVTQRFGKFQRLWGQYAVTNMLPGMAEDCALLNQYYTANLQRNERFVEHISGLDDAAAPRAAVSATSLDEHLKNTELIVLVTGGFHTAGIQDLLRQRQISWVTITPAVTAVSPAAAATYEQLAREQSRVLSNTLQVGLLAQISVYARIQLTLKGVAETDLPAVLDELKRQTGIAGRYQQGDHTITFDTGAVIALEKNTDGVLHAVQRVAATTVSPAVQQTMTELLHCAKLGHALATGNVDFIVIDALDRAAASNLINGNGLITLITSDPRLNSKEKISSIQADILATFPASIQRAIARYQRTTFNLADPEQRSAWIPLLIAASLLGPVFYTAATRCGIPPKTRIEIVNPNLRIGAIKACVFDWDGTIADSFWFWKEVEAEIIAGYIITAGYDRDEALAWANDINEKSNGKPVALKRNMVATRVEKDFPGTVVPSSAEFLKTRETALMDRYTVEKAKWKNGEVPVPLLPGILDFLGALKERNIKCLVASGSPQDELEMKAADMGVTGYFEALHASPAVKADVLSGLLSTDDQSGYQANEVIMFGDAPADMAAAKQAGCIAIGIAKTAEDKGSLIDAGADIILWNGYAGVEDSIFSGEDSFHSTESTFKHDINPSANRSPGVPAQQVQTDIESAVEAHRLLLSMFGNLLTPDFFESFTSSPSNPLSAVSLYGLEHTEQIIRATLPLIPTMLQTLQESTSFTELYDCVVTIDEFYQLGVIPERFRIEEDDVRRFMQALLDTPRRNAYSLDQNSLEFFALLEEIKQRNIATQIHIPVDQLDVLLDDRAERSDYRQHLNLLVGLLEHEYIDLDNADIAKTLESAFREHMRQSSYLVYLPLYWRGLAALRNHGVLLNQEIVSPEDFKDLFEYNTSYDLQDRAREIKWKMEKLSILAKYGMISKEDLAKVKGVDILSRYRQHADTTISRAALQAATALAIAGLLSPEDRKTLGATPALIEGLVAPNAGTRLDSAQAISAMKQHAQIFDCSVPEETALELLAQKRIECISYADRIDRDTADSLAAFALLLGQDVLSPDTHPNLFSAFSNDNLVALLLKHHMGAIHSARQSAEILRLLKDKGYISFVSRGNGHYIQYTADTQKGKQRGIPYSSEKISASFMDQAIEPLYWWKDRCKVPVQSWRILSDIGMLNTTQNTIDPALVDTLLIWLQEGYGTPPQRSAFIETIRLLGQGADTHTGQDIAALYGQLTLLPASIDRETAEKVYALVRTMLAAASTTTMADDCFMKVARLIKRLSGDDETRIESLRILLHAVDYTAAQGSERARVFLESVASSDILAARNKDLAADIVAQVQPHADIYDSCAKTVELLIELGITTRQTAPDAVHFLQLITRGYHPEWQPASLTALNAVLSSGAISVSNFGQIRLLFETILQGQDNQEYYKTYYSCKPDVFAALTVFAEKGVLSSENLPEVIRLFTPKNYSTFSWGNRDYFYFPALKLLAEKEVIVSNNIDIAACLFVDLCVNADYIADETDEATSKIMQLAEDTLLRADDLYTLLICSYLVGLKNMEVFGNTYSTTISAEDFHKILLSPPADIPRAALFTDSYSGAPTSTKRETAQAIWTHARSAQTREQRARFLSFFAQQRAQKYLSTADVTANDSQEILWSTFVAFAMDAGNLAPVVFDYFEPFCNMLSLLSVDGRSQTVHEYLKTVAHIFECIARPQPQSTALDALNLDNKTAIVRHLLTHYYNPARLRAIFDVYFNSTDDKTHQNIESYALRSNNPLPAAFYETMERGYRATHRRQERKLDYAFLIPFLDNLVDDETHTTPEAEIFFKLFTSKRLHAWRTLKTLFRIKAGVLDHDTSTESIALFRKALRLIGCQWHIDRVSVNKLDARSEQGEYYSFQAAREAIDLLDLCTDLLLIQRSDLNNHAREWGDRVMQTMNEALAANDKAFSDYYRAFQYAVAQFRYYYRADKHHLLHVLLENYHADTAPERNPLPALEEYAGHFPVNQDKKTVLDLMIEYTRGHLKEFEITNAIFEAFLKEAQGLFKTWRYQSADYLKLFEVFRAQSAEENLPALAAQAKTAWEQNSYVAFKGADDRLYYMGFTDNFATLLNLGNPLTFRSCQATYSPQYNHGLSGYVCNGWNKAITIFNENGTFVARRIVRLRLSTDHKLILLREKTYGDAQFNQAMDRQLAVIAHAMGVLYQPDHGAAPVSISFPLWRGHAAWDYSDMYGGQLPGGAGLIIMHPGQSNDKVVNLDVPLILSETDILGPEYLPTDESYFKVIVDRAHPNPQVPFAITDFTPAMPEEDFFMDHERLYYRGLPVHVRHRTAPPGEPFVSDNCYGSVYRDADGILYSIAKPRTEANRMHVPGHDVRSARHRRRQSYAPAQGVSPELLVHIGVADSQLFPPVAQQHYLQVFFADFADHHTGEVNRWKDAHIDGQSIPVWVAATKTGFVFYLDLQNKEDPKSLLTAGAAQILTRIAGTDTLPGDPVAQRRLRNLLRKAGAAIRDSTFTTPLILDHTDKTKQLRKDLAAMNVTKPSVFPAEILDAVPAYTAGAAVRKRLITGRAWRETAAENLLLKIDADDVRALVQGTEVFNAVRNVQAVFDWQELMNLRISESDLRAFLARARKQGVLVGCIAAASPAQEAQLIELGFARIYAPDTLGNFTLGSMQAVASEQKEILDITIPDDLSLDDLPAKFAQLPLGQTLMFHSNDLARMRGTDDILERTRIASFFNIVLAFGEMQITTPAAAQRLGFNWDVQELPTALTADQLKALSGGNLEDAWIDRNTAWYEQALAFTEEPLRRAFCSALARKICIREALLQEHKNLAAAYGAGTYRFADPRTEELLGEAAYRIFCMTPEERAAEQAAGTALRARLSGTMNTSLTHLQKNMNEGHAATGTAAAVLQILLQDIIADYHLRKHAGNTYGTIDLRLFTAVLAAA